MARHALKIAGLAVTMLVTMGAYWATQTDNRLFELESGWRAVVVQLTRIETKLDQLQEQNKQEK